MSSDAVMMAGLLSVALVLVALIVVFGRLRIEKQKTLQRLLEMDESSRPEWARELGSYRRRDADFRRGVLLIAVGLSLGAVMFFLGGVGWMLAGIPIAIGLVYLLFWKLSGSGQ